MLFLHALLLGFHSLHAAPLSPVQVPVKGPLAVTVKRGYFEYRAGKWVEDHQNEVERGLYDAAGRLIGRVEIGLIDTPYKVRTSLDAAGRVTETTYRSNEALHGTEKFRYDKAGLLQAVDSYDGDGALDERAEYVYSKAGRLAQKKIYGQGRDGIELLWEIDYAYGAKGDTRESTYRAGAARRLERVVTIDAKGNPVGEVEYDQWGKAVATYAYQYDYDASGLWRKQLKTKTVGPKEAVPVDVLYRAITPINPKAPATGE